MYKILIVKNRFTKKFDFKKGIEWFAKYTPLKLEITEISTDFDLTFKEIKNNTYQGVMAIPHEPLRTIVPRNTYHTVVLLYGNKAPGIRVSVADNVPLYPETDIVQVVKLNDKGSVFNHEIIHTFFTKLRRLGIYLEDPMDSVVIDGKVTPYFNDKDLNAERSNRTIALERLKPFWDRIESMSSTPAAPTPAPAVYSTAFGKAFDHLMEWEGGYVNDPNDPGGETKYGICKRSYPSLNIAALKLEDAKKIYFTDYWNPNKCEQMPYPIALNVFDMSVNMGVKTGAMVLQEALGVGIDGKIGNITLGAIGSKNQTDLVESLSVIRILRYTAIANFKIYGKGWLSRTLDTVTTSLSA